MNTWSAIYNLEKIRTYLTAGNPVWNVEVINEACDKAIEALKQTEWIPVTERLPKEECKHYWICTDTGYQCECRWTNINHIWTNLTTDWHWHIFDVPQYSHVVAWMPLPETYKVGEQE